MEPGDIIKLIHNGFTYQYVCVKNNIFLFAHKGHYIKIKQGGSTYWDLNSLNKFNVVMKG